MERKSRPVKNFSNFLMFPPHFKTEYSTLQLENHKNLGRRAGELASAVVLTVEPELTGENQTAVKATLLLEIKLFKEGELLPYTEDDLAVLEPADSQGCTKMGEAQGLSLEGCLTEVVGKACFASLSPFLLPFQARDSTQPCIMVPHFPNDRQTIGPSYSKQRIVAKVSFLLGEDVAV